MPLQPSEAELLRRALDARLVDVHTGMPGIVEKYDAATQTADVLPAVKRVIKNPGRERLVESLPVIPNVRVQWPSAGGFWFTMPLKKGDHVWLVFAEASDDKYRATGQESEPEDLRRHSLGDASCYPVPGPDSRVAPDSSADDLVIGKDGGALLTIQAGGDICIGRNAVEKLARADKVEAELQDFGAKYASHTHNGTVGPPALPNELLPVPYLPDTASDTVKGE